MRIAFLGKGGSGKTTTAAGFVRYLAESHPFVLAIDADINVHLHSALHMPDIAGHALLIGESNQEIFKYLRGDRSDLGERPMIGPTPPANSSKFVRLHREDELVKKYTVQQDNIALMCVGKYDESNVGGGCYHGKLGVLASFFHHLIDDKNDLVVADTTAGTDNVVTSLSFAYDTNVFVVEPTQKSVSVYNDFIALVPHLAERTFVVANKVDGIDDEQFILKHVDRRFYLGAIPNSRNLKHFEQGDVHALAMFDQEQRAVFDRIFQTWRSCDRDWSVYLELLRKAYAKACQDWANGMFGVDMTEGVDQSFRYESVIQNRSNEPTVFPRTATPQVQTGVF